MSHFKASYKEELDYEQWKKFCYDFVFTGSPVYFNTYVRVNTTSVKSCAFCVNILGYFEAWDKKRLIRTFSQKIIILAEYGKLECYLSFRNWISELNLRSYNTTETEL